MIHYLNTQKGRNEYVKSISRKTKVDSFDRLKKFGESKEDECIKVFLNYNKNGNKK